MLVYDTPIMFIIDTSVATRKDIPYVKQTTVQKNNKKSKVLRNSETSNHAMAQKQFLICQHCFWCASYCDYNTSNIPLKFEISNIVATRCPGYNTKDRIKSLPILYNQGYAYTEHI